jgi:hypothetical protein
MRDYWACHHMECGSDGSDLGHEGVVHSVDEGGRYAFGSERRMRWVELTET